MHVGLESSRRRFRIHLRIRIESKNVLQIHHVVPAMDDHQGERLGIPEIVIRACKVVLGPDDHRRLVPPVMENDKPHLGVDDGYAVDFWNQLVEVVVLKECLVMELFAPGILHRHETGGDLLLESFKV